MRAVPGFSFAYFGLIAVGKTAGPDGAAGAAAVAAWLFVLVRAAGATVGAAGAAVVAAGAVAGAAAACLPQLALRKAFHFWPFKVPLALASLYFALHSCLVRACAGAVATNAANADTATAHNNFV